MRFTWVLNVAVAAGSLAAVAFGVQVGTATVKPFDGASVMRVLTLLAIVALFVERAIEVTVGAWRGQTADHLASVAESARSAHGSGLADGMLREDVALAERRLLTYRGDTKALAVRAAVMLGLVAAATGVSALDSFVTPQPGRTAWFFRLFDIVLTGATIGGGSEPIHKMMSLITTYMETARSHAEVARPAVPPPTPGAPVI